MSDYVPRNMYKLEVGNQNNDTILSARTRTGAAKGYRKWAGLDKADLGDMLRMHGHEYDRNEDKEKYSKKNPDRVRFDEQEVKKWVKANNKKIMEKARLRYLGLL